MKKEKPFLRLMMATIHSVRGLHSVWRTESAFRQEFLLLVLAIVVVICLGITGVEQILLISSIALVLIAETVNSAIETIVDRISKEQHPLSGRAKDIGSATVFLCILLAIYIWIYILMES